MAGRDPFDVLGLEPGASPDEVAAAYRRLARQHHPDGHPDDDDRQRARREERMAEINEAHRAIRDGWTRPTPPPAPDRPPSPRTRPARPRVPPPPPPAQPAEPDLTEPPTGDPVSPWRVFAVLLFATAALLAGIAIVVAVISPETTTPPDDNEPLISDVESWTVGTCVSDGPTAEPIRCEFPHRGQVVAEVFSAAQCPPASDAYVSDPPRFLCVDFDA